MGGILLFLLPLFLFRVLFFLFLFLLLLLHPRARDLLEDAVVTTRPGIDTTGVPLLGDLEETRRHCQVHFEDAGDAALVPEAEYARGARIPGL